MDAIQSSKGNYKVQQIINLNQLLGVVTEP